MSPEQHPRRQLVGVAVHGIRFELHDGYEPVAPLKYSILTDSDVTVDDNLASGRILFHSEVEWRATDPGEPIPGPFDLELTLLGEYVLDGTNADHEELAAWIEFNSDHLLWPYLRAQIATITAAAGVPPLTIFTIRVPTLDREWALEEPPSDFETSDPLHDIANG